MLNALPDIQKPLRKARRSIPRRQETWGEWGPCMKSLPCVGASLCRHDATERQVSQ
jgi:hypothetical protein